jgi:hypothetical protein
MTVSSPSGELDGMAQRAEALRHALTVIALYLDGAVLHGAAGAAEALELGGDVLERDAPRAEAAYHGDDLAAAVASVAEDAHDAILGDAPRHGA